MIKMVNLTIQQQQDIAPGFGSVQIDPSTGKEISGTFSPAFRSGTPSARRIQEQIAKQAAETQTQLLARKKQEAVKAAQEKKRKEEAIKTAREAAQIRQERIRGGTIAGQFETRAPPSDIGLPPSISEQARLGATGGLQAPSPRFTTGRLKQAAREFLFIEGTPIKAARTLAEPLQRIAPTRAGEVEFVTGAEFGTISIDQLPPGAGVPITTTGFRRIEEELIARPELLIPSGARAQRISETISRELGAELQPQVTAGQLTVPQAEVEFQKQFTTRFESRIGEVKSSDIIRGRVERGRQPALDVPRAVELGAILGGSLTPFGAQIVGASFVAEGLPRITGGETFFQKGLGVAEVGLGLVGGGFAVRAAERAADISLVRELQQQRGLIDPSFSRELQRGPLGSEFQIRTTRQFGKEASLVTETRFPIFRIQKPAVIKPSETGIPTVIRAEEDFFAITGGRGVSQLKFFSVAKGRVITTTEKFGFQVPQIDIAKGQIGTSIPSRGVSVRPIEDFTGFTGRGLITKPGEPGITRFAFGGISKELQAPIGPIIAARGGGLSGVKLPKALKGLTFREAGTLEPLSIQAQRFQFRVTERGFIKRLPPKADDGISFIRPADITKTPLQTTFAPPLPVSGLTTQLEKQVISLPKIIKPTPSRGLAAPSARQLTTTQDISGVSLGPQISAVREPTFFPKVDIRTDIGLGEISPGRVRVTPFQEGIIRETQQEKALLKSLQGQELTPLFREAGRQKISQRQLLEQRQLQETLFPGITTPTTPIGGFAFGDFGFGFPPIIPPRFGGGARRKRRIRGKKIRTPIQPSFTALALDLRGALPKEFGDLGILPGRIRAIPTKRKVKKKAVKKKKKK